MYNCTVTHDTESGGVQSNNAIDLIVGTASGVGELKWEATLTLRPVTVVSEAGANSTIRLWPMPAPTTLGMMPDSDPISQGSHVASSDVDVDVDDDEFVVKQSRLKLPMS